MTGWQEAAGMSWGEQVRAMEPGGWGFGAKVCMAV